MAIDRVPKPRYGTDNPRAKLNPEIIRKIRADTRKNVEIAKIYNISDSQVSAIKKRRLWAHVTDE